MLELTNELQWMADDAASQAQPLSVAQIIREGERRRRRSLTGQTLGGLSVAGVIGGSIALSLALTGSTSTNGPGTGATESAGTIRTAGFTLVSDTNGVATLTMNPTVLFDSATLESDLAKDGIPAKVTDGSFCSSDPAPAGYSQVVSVSPLPQGGLPVGDKSDASPQNSQEGNAIVPDRTVTINPAAMPDGAELSVGIFEVPNGEEVFSTLIDASSYTCSNTPPDSGNGTVHDNNGLHP